MAMDETTAKNKIAVIGFGPRGLGALEALAALHADGDTPFQVEVFDPYPAPGAGPNFDPAESDICLLNIPMRDISSAPPAPLNGPSFAQWLSDAPGPDTFPTRADLGRYLEARYAALRSTDALTITHHSIRVDTATKAETGWDVRTADMRYGPYAEVLLTLGQPPVSPDDQLAEWTDHAASSSGTLAQAYPAQQLEERAKAWAGKTVAIRGLALSAFDVLRALTLSQGGRFEGDLYNSSGREPARILPFSLDGKPPFPKPETSARDAIFEPTASETDAFEAAMHRASRTTAKAAQKLIMDALVPPVVRILETGEDSHSVAEWLEAEFSAPGSQETDGPLETLETGIDIASGVRAPTIGYIVGQLWRKWQNPLRAALNPANTPAETAKLIVGFDEGLKRYSYGPPVSSSRELRALVKAGIVDLALVKDPAITLIQSGWRLEVETRSGDAEVMVDAVLPPPDPTIVCAPLVEGLLEQGHLVPGGKGLAARTNADGRLIDADGKPAKGLCLLGRLALGSVIAADSLHDCFGAAAHRWAAGVRSRLS